MAFQLSIQDVYKRQGLPEKTVKEAQDRVRSALMNAQFKYPAKPVSYTHLLYSYRQS